jgi:hypothetical protein
MVIKPEKLIACMASTKVADACETAPANADSEKASILDFGSLDDERKLSLMMFFVLALVFAFTLFTYSRIGLEFSSIVDLSNTDGTIAKVLSPASAMFLFAVSLSIAVAAFASRGLRSLDAAGLAAFATFIPAILLGFLYSTYLYPFIAFAFGIIGTAFFASRLSRQNASLSEAYATVNWGIRAFSVVAFLLTFIAVSLSPAVYLDKVVTGMISGVPVIMNQGAGIGAKIIANYQINQTSMEQLLPRDSVLQQLYAQVRSQVEQMMPRDSVRAQLSTSVPGFSSLNQSAQDAMIDAVYEASISKIINATNEDAMVASYYNQSVVLINSQKMMIATSLEKMSKEKPAPMSAEQIVNIKAQFAKDPMYPQFVMTLPIALSIAVLSISSIVSLLVKVLGSILTFLAFKLQKKLSENTS